MEVQTFSLFDNAKFTLQIIKTLFCYIGKENKLSDNIIFNTNIDIFINIIISSKVKF